MLNRLWTVVVGGALGVGACAPSSWATETDQFTLPPGRSFADLGPHLTSLVYEKLVDAVDELNGRIELELSRGLTDELTALRWHEPYEVARALRREFPRAVTFIEMLERQLQSEDVRRTYPGQLTSYKAKSSIFDHASFPLDPGTFWRMWRSSTIKIGDVYLGVDKMGHFFDKGFICYDRYASALENGGTHDEAVAAAVAIGTGGHIFFSEKGVVGYWTSGAFSNADLATDYLGHKFYRNLTSEVVINGETNPPMLERDGPYWRLADHVRRDTDFFTRYICHHMNGALNPCLYNTWIRDGVRKSVAERSARTIAFYADANGVARARSVVDSLTRDLRTYYGESYGHDGTDDTLVTLANTTYDIGDGALAQGSFEAARLALRDGDLRLLQSPLVADEIIRDPEALHLATPHPTLVGWLIERGLDVHRVDVEGRTPLHWAARGGYVETARVLLDAGAIPDAQDETGRTPLHDAAEADDGEVLRLLLTRGGDPLIRARLGMTPLHVAARGDATDHIRHLLNAGIDPDVRDDSNWTPLHHAAAVGHTDVVGALAPTADVDATDFGGVTPLHLAARRGWTGAIRALLHAGASPDVTTASGATVLDEAEFNGDQMALRAVQDGIEFASFGSTGIEVQP